MRRESVCAVLSAVMVAACGDERSDGCYKKRITIDDMGLVREQEMVVCPKEHLEPPAPATAPPAPPPPPPPPLPTLRTARLFVSVKPVDAVIKVDGHERASKSPTTLEVAPGKHVIRAEHAGYRSSSREVSVREGSGKVVDFQLEEIPVDPIANSTTREVGFPDRAPEDVLWLSMGSGRHGMTLQIHPDGTTYARTAFNVHDIQVSRDMLLRVSASDGLLERARKVIQGGFDGGVWTSCSDRKSGMLIWIGVSPVPRKPPGDNEGCEHVLASMAELASVLDFSQIFEVAAPSVTPEDNQRLSDCANYHPEVATGAELRSDRQGNLHLWQVHSLSGLPGPHELPCLERFAVDVAESEAVRLSRLRTERVVTYWLRGTNDLGGLEIRFPPGARVSIGGEPWPLPKATNVARLTVVPGRYLLAVNDGHTKRELYVWAPSRSTANFDLNLQHFDAPSQLELTGTGARGACHWSLSGSRTTGFELLVQAARGATVRRKVPNSEALGLLAAAVALKPIGGNLPGQKLASLRPAANARFRWAGPQLQMKAGAIDFALDLSRLCSPDRRESALEDVTDVMAHMLERGGTTCSMNLTIPHCPAKACDLSDPLCGL